MDVTIRQLEAFIAVADSKNFTLASELLQITQPMVSSLIRNLESDLGLKLFDRSTRRVELTETAIGFLGDARRLLGDLQGAVHRAQDLASRRRGRVIVGAPPLLAAALLPPVVKIFARTSPGISITVIDRSVAQIYRLLQDGKVDLAIGTFRDNEDRIARTPLVEYAFALLCRADDPLASNAKPCWRDLSEARLLTLRKGNGIREQVEAGYAAAGCLARPAFELDQLTTIIAMVEAGLGITVLPSYAIKTFSSTSLVARPLGEPLVFRKIDVAHRQDEALSPASNQFVRQLRITAKKLQIGSHSGTV